MTATRYFIWSFATGRIECADAAEQFAMWERVGADPYARKWRELAR